MTKKNKNEKLWLIPNKKTNELYTSSMQKMIEHTNQIFRPFDNDLSDQIIKLQNFLPILDNDLTDQIKKLENSFPYLDLSENHFLKFDNLNINYTKSPNIDEILNSIDTHLLENPFVLIDNPFADGLDKISTIELEVDSYEKTDKDEKEVAKVIHTTPKIIKSIYEDHGILKIINPRKFEEVIAELLEAKGFETQLTKQTRDGGYDIFAFTKVSGIPIEMIVECKRHKNTVGVDIVRSFCDVISDMKPNKGLIFTTSYFSPEAKERKRKMGAMLDLHDRDDLLHWIMEYLATKNKRIK